MATTKLSNLVNPQVMGDMIDAKITALLKITPYAKLDTTLQGVPGDTKTVPSWNYIGDAEDVAEGVEVDTTAMTASTTTFTIKKAMKSVALTQEAINSGYGDPVGQAESQLAKAIAGKVDNDVLAAAYTSPNIYNGLSAIIGYKPIVEAVGKFLDEEDGVEKVMFIHPEQETQLLKDSDFISADKFQSGVAVNGAIGKIAGCWIKKSLKVTKADAVSAVTGVYTVTIGGSVASGDKITIAGVETTLDSTSGASASAAVTAIKAKTFTDYSVTGSGAILTFTEKSDHEGAGIPDCASTNSATTFTKATTTAGIAAEVAKYVCPIVKLEPDSAETEYTETELPALTIFLKKDTQTDSEFKPRSQVHEITTAKYYGVALTNAAKVVVAKFAQVSAS